MAFDVSYIFTARDKYSAVAKKIVRVNKKLEKSTTAAALAFSRKLVPALISVGNKTNATRARLKTLTTVLNNTASANAKIQRNANKAAKAISKIGNKAKKTKVQILALSSAMKSNNRVMTTRTNPIIVSMGNKAQRTNTKVAALGRTIKNKLQPAMTSIRNTGLGMSAAITLPFFLAAKAATNMASDAEETANKFATVFLGLGSDAEDVADTFAKNFGMAGSSARKLLGDTGDLLTGFGLSKEKALDLSRQVQELAVDLASFTNIEGGAADASHRLTTALFGERESMKALGVVITEAGVKSKILSMIAKGATFDSLLQAKAIATLAIAVEQSKNAIGDYARTQNDAANISRLLGEKTKTMAESFGKILLPMQVKINKSLIGMTERLSKLSPSMKKTMLIVGGVIAVLGPLLLVIGMIGLALPILAVGFAAIGAVLAALASPIGIVIGLTAALIIFLAKSESVRAFFKGVGLGISESMGPTLSALMDDLKAAGNIMSELFGSGSSADKAIGESTEQLKLFGDAGKKVGDIIGTAFNDVIIVLRIVGDLIGQITAAIATLDLSNFDFSKFKKLAAEIDLGFTVPDKVFTDAASDTNSFLSGINAEIRSATDSINSAVSGFFKSGDKVNITDVSPGIPIQIQSPINNVIKIMTPPVAPVSSPSPLTPITASPAVATANARATINGQITVSATEGTRIDSVTSQDQFTGAQGDIGLGVAQ